MERVDPSALRWLIGVELTNYRKQAGASQAEVGKALKISGGMVAHFEVGRHLPSPQQIDVMLSHYGAPRYDIDRLSYLAGRADKSSWLARWNDVIPDWARTYVGLEGLASHVVAYAPSVLNALTQTREYSLGATAHSARVRADQEERMVGLRMERQHRLYGENSLHLTMIIEESVLDRPIGGREVMRGQLEHLLDLAERDNIDILVLPITVGRHDSLEGKFSLLHFRDAEGQPQAQSVVYVEIPDDSIYIQEQRQVAQYTRNADQLREVALSPAESAAAIRTRLAAFE
ncbi:helix-turn-helix domain-containing protein [Actinokineospora globicatena]|uniref:helix-turn-helix domain-containing protein n=1 Tax=Actinokineospora globicatena TaxID=103729 RepID=UPI0020A4473F|nr:helix-turn-helix transcriptional regulator [Actinokineospora globicatena]MCP2301822.1 Helix-turn-helix domain-containing protein [Actinokineospora globicatena]GLW76520.1 transcriptional regulator [Actinokineospora globicatena]GLW83355.1 transcriptional regulator [Actinokineospora globicatena]